MVRRRDDDFWAGEWTDVPVPLANLKRAEAQIDATAAINAGVWRHALRPRQCAEPGGPRGVQAAAAGGHLGQIAQRQMGDHDSHGGGRQLV